MPGQQLPAHVPEQQNAGEWQDYPEPLTEREVGY
jgi:hypothetical protein